MSPKSLRVKGDNAFFIRTRRTLLSVVTHRLRKPFRCYERSKIVVTFIWPLQGHQGKRHATLWILGVKFLLEFPCSYGSISHHLGVNCDSRPLWRHRGHSRSKVKVPFDQSTHVEHFVNRHPIGYGQPRLGGMNYQKLFWPSFNLLMVIKAKGHVGFWILGYSSY